jgi:hypothetical protein
MSKHEYIAVDRQATDHLTDDRRAIDHITDDHHQVHRNPIRHIVRDDPIRLPERLPDRLLNASLGHHDQR